jgi:hypothetical protein
MRAGRVAVLLAVELFVAGCGIAPGQSGYPTSSPAAATSADPGSGRPATVAGCPNYVLEPETGPFPSDLSEDGPIARDQQRLQGDLALAQDYATRHAADFGSIRFENTPRVRIVIGFVTNLQQHCAALRGALEFADEFEVIWSPATNADLEALLNEITNAYRDYLVGAGLMSDAIELTLRADGEAIAAEITAKYGSLVDIWVGMLHYPDRGLGEGGGCARFLHEPAIGLPLRASVKRLSQVEIRSGADFSGDVTVVNVGSTAFDFESGRPQTALILGPDGRTLVGAYFGAIAGTGAGALIEPGGTYDMDFLGGTASCDPAVGYAVPPGEAFVVVPVDVYRRTDPNGPPEVLKLMSEPMPIRVVP